MAAEHELGLGARLHRARADHVRSSLAAVARFFVKRRERVIEEGHEPFPMLGGGLVDLFVAERLLADPGAIVGDAGD